ncbi:polyadenylate-binding protein RBP45C [Pistacia vera]|uniref:polyadenylate-binding protein RBP45C n=1 Tax=Pistacia vera TaxID=55513 RepID=UPI001263285E|nr:polyadenylate-binding protein RBP45C [Pistacia vera]
MMQQPPPVPSQVVPPPTSDQGGQYQQQQWMTYQQPPQQQPPVPPPAGWTPQPVPPPSQQQYAVPPDTATDGIRSLWIGDLQQWMDENYLIGIFAHTGEVISAKVIRNKQTNFPEGYGFIEFVSHAAAERVLQSYNGSQMPNSEQNFRLNWATYGAGERRPDEGPDYTIFVGDLAADVTDYMLQETFRGVYPSVKGAKVVTDRTTGRSKGYGFVRFGDENEQLRSMTEMNGVLCSTRPMRIGPAATKKPVSGQQFQKATYQNAQGNQGENDPNNTTIFVGGLDPSVTDDILKTVFGQYGELVHVKIPVGKRCGFVQFANRACAEQALSMLNGTQLGGQNIRLSWGRSPSNKQDQPDQAQWNGGGYYGYPQGYEAYGYAPPPQDPNMYYGGYPGYGNYQQPGAYQQPQQ